MEAIGFDQHRDATEDKPLVEVAPDEAVVRALAQSAHPVEWKRAHKPLTEPADD